MVVIIHKFYLNSVVKSDTPTRKGFDPPTPKEAPGSQRSSPGALKRTIRHFNCTLIVDMEGEKKSSSLTMIYLVQVNYIRHFNQIRC